MPDEKRQSERLREWAMVFAEQAADSLRPTPSQEGSTAVEVGSARNGAYVEQCASAAHDLMRAAAMAFEMESRQPATPTPGSEEIRQCVGEMGGLLVDLMNTFEGSDSEVATRIAARIRAVLEKWGYLPD